MHQDFSMHLQNLKVLSLSSNPFSVIDHNTVSALGGLLHLEELDLSYCALHELPDHVFNGPR